MKVTNKLGLPRVFEIIAANDEYTRGSSARSVTQLIDAPQVVNLRSIHDATLADDVSDMFYMMMGNAVHAMLEKAAENDPNIVTEQRYYGEMEDWTISGAIDVQDYYTVDGKEFCRLQDYKYTSVWSVINAGDKKGWERQLNLYHWLYMFGSSNKEFRYAPVTNLQIVVLIRDWFKRDADVKEGYPPAPIHVIDVPMWSEEYTIEYLKDRIRRHKLGAVNAALFPELLEQCDSEDMWEKPAMYAVFNGDNQKATRVFDEKEKAEEYIAKSTLKRPWIEDRLGDRTRCVNDYCKVAEFCKQYAASKVPDGS